MNTRTDAHRPSAIVPADYDFVAFEYLRVDDIGSAMFLQSERARIRSHMEQSGGTYSGHQHGGNCHICGSVNAIYTALFHHRPSNVYVRTGLDCAEKLECRGIEAFRRNCAHALEARAGKRKAVAVLEAAGLSAAWPIYEAGSDKREESTVIDIVGRLVQYGSISDGQTRYVASLLSRIANRSVIEAQRKAEAEAVSPVPVSSERITVAGKVLTVREPDENAAFPSYKILVQADAGWKVWGSRPASLSSVKIGERVEFSAAVTVSDKDTKFGFFSRPTKARIVEGVAA